MSRELVLELTPFGARAAAMHDGRLIELRFADHEASDIRGEVFLGRVTSVDANLDAAFVDCGEGRLGYLTSRDARYVSGKRKEGVIGEQLTEGQAVLVQGQSASSEGKKPKVSSDIQLTGMYLVYRPRRRSIKISSRLGDTVKADWLKGQAVTLFPDGGVTLRRAAVLASEQDLVAEAERLKETWHKIENDAAVSNAPCCLLNKQDPLHRVLHEALTPEVDQILVNDSVAMVRARSYLESWLPSFVPKLKSVLGAFEAAGVNEQIDQAIEPRVPLEGGGDIVIQPTSALTAIDVNSGGRAALETNLEAAVEIARQLRLRRIGGTIVVDFIDMNARSDRDRLVEALTSALKGDPAATQVVPGAFGLVQISRQRLGPSLSERLTRSCPTCSGSGAVAALRASSERLLGELVKNAKGRGCKVRVSADLHHYVVKDASARWSEFIKHHGLVTPSLLPDSDLPPGSYQLETGGHG